MKLSGGGGSLSGRRVRRPGLCRSWWRYVALVMTIYLAASLLYYGMWRGIGPRAGSVVVLDQASGSRSGRSGGAGSQAGASLRRYALQAAGGPKGSSPPPPAMVSVDGLSPDLALQFTETWASWGAVQPPGGGKDVQQPPPVADAQPAARTLRFQVCNGFANQRLGIVYGVLFAARTNRTPVLPDLLEDGTQMTGDQVGGQGVPGPAPGRPYMSTWVPGLAACTQARLWCGSDPTCRTQGGQPSSVLGVGLPSLRADAPSRHHPVDLSPSHAPMQRARLTAPFGPPMLCPTRSWPRQPTAGPLAACTTWLLCGRR